MGMKQFHKEQEAILQQQVVQDDAVVKEDEEEIAEVKQRLKQVIHHKLAPVQASILEEADVELGTASVPVAPDPGSEEVTDEDVEEEDRASDRAAGSRGGHAAEAAESSR